MEKKETKNRRYLIIAFIIAIITIVLLQFVITQTKNAITASGNYADSSSVFIE